MIGLGARGRTKFSVDSLQFAVGSAQVVSRKLRVGG